MAEIGALVASGLQTLNPPVTYENIMIDDVDLDSPLTKLEVVINRETTINITVQALIRAFSKMFMSGLLGADVKVGQNFKIATGEIERESTVRMTNGAATTPAVYGNSRKGGGVPIKATNESQNASSSNVYSGFLKLAFDPTNVDHVDLTFASGYTDTFDPQEIDALYAENHITDADGRLSGVSVISLENGDNEMDAVVSAKVFTTNGGAVDVLIVTV